METLRAGECAMNILSQKTKMSRLMQHSLFLCLMTIAAPSHSATVSFFLNESNRLPDGINYLSVNLTENLAGGVDVLAQTLDPLNDLRSCGFGIQKFAFSFDDGTMGDVTGLPDGWKVKSDRRMNGFGKFDTGLLGNAHTRTDILSFTINGVGIDDFESYFAVKVGGLDDSAGPSNAFFGGSLEDGSTSIAHAPVPAAAWLFGSGLLGLIGAARRRRK